MAHRDEFDSELRRRKPVSQSNQRAWTDREKAWLRFGATLAVIGLIGAVLPLFGLKFRKVRDGDMQVPVSIGLAILGGAISLFTTIRHGSFSGDFLSKQVQRNLAYALGGVGLFFVVLCTGLLVWNNVRKHNPQPAIPQHVVQVPQNQAMPRPARLILTNIKNLDLTPLRAKIAPLIQRPEMAVGLPPRLPRDEFTISFLIGGDIEEFARKIDFGQARVTDPSSRTVTVIVDRSQFSERK